MASEQDKTREWEWDGYAGSDYLVADYTGASYTRDQIKGLLLNPSNLAFLVDRVLGILSEDIAPEDLRNEIGEAMLGFYPAEAQTQEQRDAAEAAAKVEE